MGRALQTQATVVQMLSDAIDAVYAEEREGRAMGDNLKKHLNLVISLDKYLTHNNDLLDNFMEKAEK